MISPEKKLIKENATLSSFFHNTIFVRLEIKRLSKKIILMRIKINTINHISHII